MEDLNLENTRERFRDVRNLYISEHGKNFPAVCQFENCKNNTHDHKPYCPKHITESPYVKELLKNMEKGAIDEPSIALRYANKSKIKRAK